MLIGEPKVMVLTRKGEAGSEVRVIKGVMPALSYVGLCVYTGLSLAQLCVQEVAPWAELPHREQECVAWPEDES